MKAGSIIPTGPELKYAAEKPADPITLYVYAGANGSFVLYEDDGLTYDYKKGAFSEIPLTWDDTSSTLTIGQRKGSFHGMLKERTFNLVLVSKTNPTGFAFEPKVDKTINYNDRALVLTLK